jgi:hypothetical protein
MQDRGISETYVSRIIALRARHALLKARVEEAYRSPATEDFYLKQLKKKKLQLKDQITEIAEGEERGAVRQAS